MTTAQDTIELLGSVSAFSGLPVDDLERVADVVVPRRFAAGEMVFHEGDRGDTCYVVRHGRFRSVSEHRIGRTLTLATFETGDIFGELAMFDDEQRAASVEAVQDGEVAAILGRDMRRLLRVHPEIAVRLLGALSRRLRRTSERLARHSFTTVQSRVAAALSELVSAARSQGAGPTDVLITATQADLAQMAGASRESASRFLAGLERAGVIVQGRGKLTVRDPGRLEGYVY
ncbi:MAG: Crp/Fnr family transcriptional regulator [Solirubrobacterales bacterium]|nr:Crp/Fnr family transcriptional regulator [Solirubrobacterales bacterium]